MEIVISIFATFAFVIIIGTFGMLQKVLSEISETLKKISEMSEEKRILVVQLKLDRRELEETVKRCIAQIH